MAQGPAPAFLRATGRRRPLRPGAPVGPRSPPASRRQSGGRMSDEKRAGSPVTPVLTQRGVFIPEVGRRMVLALPGENVSGEVVERLSDDVLVMKITGIVLNKAGHGYRTNDHVPCERGVND